MDYSRFLNSFIAIAKINQSLSEINEKAPNGRKEIDKIVSNLGELLKNIDDHASAGFTPLTESHIEDIQSSLEGLHLNLAAHAEGGHSAKISDLNKQIAEVQDKVKKAVEVYSDLSKPKIPPFKVVSLAFFSDISCPDSNGAISTEICKAIEQGVPFITSSSLLQEKGTEKGIALCEKMRGLLLAKKNEFEIYESNGVLVFIPCPPRTEDGEKRYEENLHELNEEQLQRLRAFDFDPSQMKPITAKMAIDESREKIKISDVFTLFSEKPKANKLFYIAGHGGADSVAAMDEHDYKLFLAFLEKQHCKGLAIFSCYSGGASSMLNVPESVSTERASFLDQKLSSSFPTLVKSIGDFVSGVMTDKVTAEDDLIGFMKEFAKFVESSEVKTAEQFGQQLNKFEGDKDKNILNLMKLSVGKGFRLLNEKGKDYPLTIAKVREAELSSKKFDPTIPLRVKKWGSEEMEAVLASRDDSSFRIKNESSDIVIKWADRLEVHPLVTQPSLQFVGKNPILISMIPGRAHHFIRKIKLSDSFSLPLTKPQNPIEFIANVSYLHEFGKLNKNKGFFINEISSPTMLIKDVVISLSPSGSCCYFRMYDEYYKVDMKGASYTTTRTNALEYSFNSENVLIYTRPQEKAIRMASAGLEGESDFMEAIEGAHFFSPLYHLLIDRTNLPRLAFVPNSLEIIKNRTPYEKEGILSFLLKKNALDIVFELILNNVDIKLPSEIYQKPSFWSSIAKLHPMQKAAQRADDPQGKVFERLLSAGMPVDNSNPEVLSKFMIRVLSEGNSELFTMCAKQLSLETESALWLLIQKRKDIRAAALYLKANNGIRHDALNLTRLIKNRDAAFLKLLKKAGLDPNTKISENGQTLHETIVMLES